MTIRPATKEQTLAAASRETPGTLGDETQSRTMEIVQWLEEKKARNIAALDVTPFSSVADVMVIATAQGARHAQALADWLLERFAAQGIAYLGMEGYAEGQWILVDGNDILVHILQEKSRAFYNLDGLWGGAALLTPQPSASVTPA